MRVPAERRVHDPGAAGKRIPHQRDIFAHQRARAAVVGEQVRQPPMRRVGLGDHQQPRRVLVQPMHDPRPLDPADARQRRAAMADQRIDQRAAGVAGSRVGDEPRGLVDDHEVAVLVDDVERNILARRRRLHKLGRVERDHGRPRRACARACRRRRRRPAPRRPRSAPSTACVKTLPRPAPGTRPAARRPPQPRSWASRSLASAPTHARRGGFLRRRRHQRPQRRDDGLDARTLRRSVFVERAAHRRDMLGLVAAAAADDPRARRPPPAARNPPSAPACRNNGYARHAIAARRRWPWRSRAPRAASPSCRAPTPGDRRRRPRNWRRRRAGRCRTPANRSA